MPTIIVSEDGTQKSKCSVQFRRCQIGMQFWWEKQMMSEEFINNFDQKKQLALSSLNFLMKAKCIL
jgi:hypothetical protein